MSGWYLSRAGQQTGPFDDRQIQQMALQGQLGADSYLAGPGLSGWVPASQVPLVAAALSQAGGQPQPPGWQQPIGHGMPALTPVQGQPHPAAGFAAVAQAPALQAPPGLLAPSPPALPFGAPPAGPGPAPAGPRVRQSSWVKERLKGLAAIGVAAAVLVLNGVSLAVNSSFYPKTLILALGAGGFGAWVVIFGDEYDDFTMQLVRWKQIGMWACAVLGALAGLGISILLAS
jgi:hypothetical protein